MIKKYGLALFLGLFIVACQSETKENVEEAEVVATSNTDHHSGSISKVFAAHGGYDAWNDKKQLSFQLASGEKQLIELQSRKVLIESENRTVGYDGENVWVKSEDGEVGNARFYHNLYFYFFSMPFVFGDPGVYYEDMPDKEMMGKTYKAVKISYGADVGDSPKDNYIVYFDPETNEMAWLMYTVTFRTQEASERFNLIRYDSWSDVNGVKLPTAIKWYQFRDGEIGDMRREITFDNIQLTNEMPADELFAMPEGAQIAPMPEATAG